MRRLGLTAGLIYAKDEAVEYCKARRALTTPKIEADVSPDYQPTSTDEAVTARRAPKNLFRVGDPAARRSASDQVAVVVCVRLEFFFACADAG